MPSQLALCISGMLIICFAFSFTSTDLYLKDRQPRLIAVLVLVGLSLMILPIACHYQNSPVPQAKNAAAQWAAQYQVKHATP